MGIIKKQKTKKHMKFFALASAAVMATMPSLKLDEVFKALDGNGDGSLTLPEIYTAVTKYAKAHGVELPEGWKTQVAGMFKGIDENADGKITMGEVKAAIFNAVDADNDGQWSLKEAQEGIQAVANQVGATLKEGWKAEVAEAFKAVDTDASGKVSPKELEAAIKKHGYPDLSGLMK